MGDRVRPQCPKRSPGAFLFALGEQDTRRGGGLYQTRAARRDCLVLTGREHAEWREKLSSSSGSFLQLILVLVVSGKEVVRKNIANIL